MSKERRMRGWQKGPCPACKKGESHPTGDICDECSTTLALARKLKRQEAERLKRSTERIIVSVPDRAYATAGYYGLGLKRMMDGLRDALFELTVAVTEPLDSHDDLNSWGRDKADGHVSTVWNVTNATDRDIASLYTVHGRDWQTYVAVHPLVRARLDALDKAIRLAVFEAYWNGKEEGSELLGSLADGRVTLADIESIPSDRKRAYTRLLDAIGERHDTDDEEDEDEREGEE